MNFKRNVFIFTIIICIFFSISCVAAEDTNDTGIAAYETQVIGDANDELISSPQEDLISSSQEDSISSSKVGTFTELQDIIYDASYGGTINLEKDYVYDEEFNDTKGILILKDLTINGNGHTLDGASKSRILFNFLAIKVTLNDIVFKNGYTNLYGGAIFNFADLTVNNCVFEKNYADTTAGAICSLASLNCKNSVFNKNIANGSAGAIFSCSIKKADSYFNKSSIDPFHTDLRGIISNLLTDFSFIPGTDYISNCKFTKNVALGRGGGAIYAFNHIKIFSSKFVSNKAAQVGGAVYGAKNLFIKNSKFTKNSASVYGGAVYFKFHELAGHYDKNGKWVTDVKFYNNTIKNCVFTENVAKDRGGAIYGFKFSELPKVEAAHAVKCTFKDNLAGSYGNEIYGGTLKSCVFKNTLTLKSVKIKKSAKKLVLSVKLKKGSKPIKYKKVTFKFNGKTYKAKTNYKGIAKVTIPSSILKKLKLGKTIKYQASFGKFHELKISKVYK